MMKRRWQNNPCTLHTIILGKDIKLAAAGHNLPAISRPQNRRV
jgi:hypothetical protein